MKIKICYNCKDKKDTRSFNVNNSRKDGLQSSCRKCDRSEARKNYHIKYSGKHKIRAKQRKEDLNKWYIELKQTKYCSGCNENRWYVLDFHHVDTHNKYMEISIMVARGYSKDKILEEINKCIVLCANCHRELHFNKSL